MAKEHRMITRLLVTIMMLLAAGIARAQDEYGEQSDYEKVLPSDYITYADTIPGFGDTIPGFKSPKSAFWISALGTVVPITAGLVFDANNRRAPAISLLCWGGLIGPAQGYLYTGDLGGAGKGVLTRTALVGATYWLWNYGIEKISHEEWTDENYKDNLWGLALSFIVPGAYLATTVKDMFDVRKSVREYNYDLLYSRHILVGPIYFPRSKAMGIGLSYRF